MNSRRLTPIAFILRGDSAAVALNIRTAWFPAADSSIFPFWLL